MLTVSETAAQQRTVSSIHDSIHLQFGDVTYDYLDIFSHCLPNIICHKLLPLRIVCLLVRPYPRQPIPESITCIVLRVPPNCYRVIS